VPNVEHRLVGHVAVDSASIAIVDPVYVAADESEWQNWLFELDIKHSLNAAESAHELVFSGDSGTGIWIATGSDGRFPVYAQYVDGALVALTVALSDAGVRSDAT
jgi:hypothetical protein